MRVPRARSQAVESNTSSEPISAFGKGAVQVVFRPVQMEDVVSSPKGLATARNSLTSTPKLGMSRYNSSPYGLSEHRMFCGKIRIRMPVFQLKAPSKRFPRGFERRVQPSRRARPA